MKQCYLILLTTLLGTVSINIYANQLESAQDTSQAKPAIMYVCGGNSGRSVMAEWYTRKHYANLVTEFSRGSGIDPDDQQTPEEYAAAIIIATHEATPAEIELQRPTAATIQDINSANLVITMTKSHKQRLLKLINRECLSSNITARDLSASSKKHWLTMCQNKLLLTQKIYTLTECATGNNTDIADAFGKDKKFYERTQNTIAKYTDMIMQNYKTTGKFCKTVN